ncbi:MAG: hypothetical protein CVU54_11265 [Deltaproteobacteria bacterium HGW-Deltaproteobacteria-12]|jgi:hypothetical protein|nr:MAG: hypothetical protein CVU54_11265 [Deltaproteobacteria bacterium HGW-Deltaproteobacteria-12]
MNTNTAALCQPDEHKSCGACCGLYNYVDSSREALMQRLLARTKRFRTMVQKPGDIESYAAATFAAEDFRKRYEGIYCCEYLGFLETERKVGCLLHPLQNSGLDMRAASFYGQETCAGHLCPSHHFISRNQALIIVKIIEDWYLYGLCLTDIDLVTEYFRILADRIGAELKPEVFENEFLSNIAREFFKWKITWPFRSFETNRLGKYYFDGSQYMISFIDYAKFGREISSLDKIFLSLSSTFASAQEIAAAEDLVMGNIQQFVAAYRKHF